jgi:hypothetical protein
MGFILKESGIQLSSQIGTVSPDPVLWIKPKLRASLPAKIARHVLDAALGTVASRKLLSGKYLLFNTWAHKEFGYIIILHACFLREQY